MALVPNATPPTEIFEWADSGVATDPAAERTSGFVAGTLAKSASVNYLIRALMRAVNYLLYVIKNQTHDGGSADTSAPKINFDTHINYGSNGELDADDAPSPFNAHIINHNSTPITGLAAFLSDGLYADKLGSRVDGYALPTLPVSSSSPIEVVSPLHALEHIRAAQTPIMIASITAAGFLDSNASNFNPPPITTPVPVSVKTVTGRYEIDLLTTPLATELGISTTLNHVFNIQATVIDNPGAGVVAFSDTASTPGKIVIVTTNTADANTDFPFQIVVYR